MTTQTTQQNMASRRPGLIKRDPGSQAQVSREDRLDVLYARWDQFVAEYQQAESRNDQELMTNLRGLLILIKKEIKRLGGKMPEFPYSDEHHLADL